MASPVTNVIDGGDAMTWPHAFAVVAICVTVAFVVWVNREDRQP